LRLRSNPTYNIAGASLRLVEDARSLSPREALLHRIQSRPYACIWTLPASLARTAHRTPATKRVMLEPLSRRVAKALCLGEGLQALQGGVLDLPDPLTRHAEGASDLFEGERLLAEQPEAELDHPPLALR
jgi:hypothetical protein